MALLNMNGPYSLNREEIDKQVTQKSAGNYALGKVSDKVFIVNYVGRSDEDLNKRLKDWVDDKYRDFKYSYASSPKKAFEKECSNYHDFGESKKLDNDKHPQRPKEANWKCPVCNVFD